MAALSPELRAWLVPGLAGVMAAADGTRQPRIARVWAARPLPGKDIIEVYTVRTVSEALLHALALSDRAALNLVEVHTYRARTFKGPCRPSPLGPDADFLAESLSAFNRAVGKVGMAPDTAERIFAHYAAPRSMLIWHLTVESAFDQSPGPGAGAAL